MASLGQVLEALSSDTRALEDPAAFAALLAKIVREFLF